MIFGLASGEVDFSPLPKESLSFQAVLEADLSLSSPWGRPGAQTAFRSSFLLNSAAEHVLRQEGHLLAIPTDPGCESVCVCVKFQQNRGTCVCLCVCASARNSYKPRVRESVLFLQIRGERVCVCVHNPYRSGV